ncbi:hypothetical protein pipiens_005750 [Culex pipiens pipiens]|uniref:Gustatory receptor n=1 Tax=Culex pipiens pipiens TaxID=38569 RepID=A0ABD1DU46_CULPP
MKYWFNIDNIHQTVGPIFRTMKWLGFLPFTLDASANALLLLRMRPSDAALLAGWQLYIGSMFFSGWMETVQELPMSKIMIYFSLLMYVVMSVLTSVIQLRLARSRAKIERLLRMIRFVDELLEQLSHGVDHSRQHLGLVALIVASFLSSLGFVSVEWTVSWFAREQTPVWKEFFHLSATIFYYAVRFASLCPLVVFIGGLLALRTRFRKLNDAFRFHFDTARQLDDDEEDDEVDVDGTARDRLRTVAVCHDGLTEVVELFCDIFNLQIISACVSYTIFCIFAMYSSVALVTQDTSGTQFVTIFYITACLHYSSHILPIMKLGSDVRNEIFSGTATYTMIMTQFELAVPRFFMGALVPDQPNATNLLAPVT